MKDLRPGWNVKRDGLERYLAWHGVLRRNRDVLVAEFPRSGGTWFCQMLSELSGIPFPRNERISREQSILHAHYQYKKQFYRPLHILRDGRDVMISAYHYFLLNDDVSVSTKTLWRKKMGDVDFHNVSDNLPRFLHVFHLNFKVAFRPVQWGDYVTRYLSAPNVLTLRYEELLESPVEALGKAVYWLDIHIDEDQIREAIEKYTFVRQTGRQRGENAPASFMRKGISGDWKNYFSREASEVFDYYAGQALILSGYEDNGDWIQKR